MRPTYASESIFLPCIDLTNDEKLLPFAYTSIVAIESATLSELLNIRPTNVEVSQVHLPHEEIKNEVGNRNKQSSTINPGRIIERFLLSSKKYAIMLCSTVSCYSFWTCFKSKMLFTLVYISLVCYIYIYTIILE